MDRQRVVMVCELCGARNYRTTKARKATPNQNRLALKKFCPACNRHTIHRESK